MKTWMTLALSLCMGLPAFGREAKLISKTPLFMQTFEVQLSPENCVLEPNQGSFANIFSCVLQNDKIGLPLALKFFSIKSAVSGTSVFMTESHSLTVIGVHGSEQNKEEAMALFKGGQLNVHLVYLGPELR